MAQSRIDLENLLKVALGSEEVYFQAPPNTKMVYPAILYELSNMSTKFADNAPYSYEKRYNITIMDFDPDSLIPDKVASLPKCTFDRFFAKDYLNHYVFVIYF